MSSSRRCVLRSLAGLLVCGQAPADNSVRVLARNDQLNAQLSTPVPQPYVAPYFTDNERGAEKFFNRFQRIGGVMIGAGFQQNFTYLVHGRPELYVFFDINPDVTEILVPFFGELMARARMRRDFLAALTGVPFSEHDVRRLLEPRPSPENKETLGAYLAGVVAGFLSRRPEQERRRSFERQLGPIIARKVLSATRRAQLSTWFDLLEEDMLAGGKFFEQSARASWIAGADDARRDQLAGWLSTEENYQLVRRAWTDGRIVGITGDINGPSVGKLAQWLRKTGEAGPPRQVTFFYLSNIGASIMGHEKPQYFAQMYRHLAQLPISGRAVTLIAQGDNVAYLRTYAQARAFYDSLQDLDTNVMIRLVELPLSYSVLGNERDALRKFTQELPAFARDPASYQELLDQFMNAPRQSRPGDIAAFREWVQNRWPSIDVSSDPFRALEAILTELAFLR
ncbi:MAG TPA: hypothetical protein VKX49_31540 [Bryobacteraceae bacterium]|nr:hypothetical protein [Bryobacteraceae bacterium]